METFEITKILKDVEVAVEIYLLKGMEMVVSVKVQAVKGAEVSVIN